MQARGLWGTLLLAAVLATVGLMSGCNLCNKHLYLYRDAPAKRLPAAEMTLLITDPGLAAAVTPATGGFIEPGCRWASEHVSPDTATYGLSVDRVDDEPVYQGLCLDTTPTYSLEMRPGPRRLHARLDLYGPWGHERVREVLEVNLKAGGVYFLQPVCAAVQERRLVLKIRDLPEPYTPELRTKVTDWNRAHDKTRGLAE